MRTATTPPTEQPASSKVLTARDRRVLESTFSIDSRALAVVRIGLGILLLVQSLFLTSPVPADAGELMTFAYEYTPIVMIPLALLLMVGLWARVVVLLGWLVYTVPLRAELLADRTVPMGYYVMSLALFWCVFLPIGRHLSLDARREARPAVRFLSVASGALLFQVFIIYFSAGLFKDIGDWVIDATAMESILGHPAYETPVGTLLLGYPGVLAVMSVATFVLEVVGSLLVIVPGKSLERRRLVLVPIFIVMHIAIALTMGLGLFPYVMIVLWLLFLPASFWDRLWKRLGSSQGVVESLTDDSRWRNGIAGVAVVLASISNLIVWAYYSNSDNMPAVFETFQDVAISLMIFQRWLMFNVPSLIPL